MSDDGKDREGHRALPSDERNPDPLFTLGMVGMLLLLPIERIAGPFSLRPVDGVILALAAWGLVGAWRSRRPFRAPLAFPMWLVLCGSLIAAVRVAPYEATPVPALYRTNLVAIVQEVYLFAWFTVFANRLAVLPLRARHRLMGVWAAVAALESLLTVMGMLRIGPAIFYTAPDREVHDFGGISRGLGTYANANAAGSFISTSLFVMLCLPVSPWLRAVLGAWYFVGMYATGSNGAILATLAALALTGLFYSVRRWRRAALVWAAGLGLGAGMALLLPMVGFSAQALLSPGLGGTIFRTSLGRIYWGIQRRTAIIANGWFHFRDRPWGVGPNTFETVSVSLHNDYIAFLFERGPLGVLGWIGIVAGTLGAALGESLRTPLHSDRTRRLMFLGAGFVANAVNAFAHEVSHSRALWLSMAFLFAEIAWKGGVE